jgi:hypothetical protein
VIVQRAVQLVSLIQRREELRSQIERLDGFRTQADEVRKARQRLEPLVEAGRLLARRGISGTASAPETSKLLSSLDQLRAQYAEDPTYILGPNRLNAVRSGVPALATTLEQHLLSTWRSYAATQRPGVNEDVLAVLVAITALRPQVGQVTSGLKNLDERSNRLPVSDADIDEFDRQAAAVRAAWNDLDSGHLPPDVLVFLKEAGSGPGAELSRFTNAVRQWLEEHRLTGAFRIRQKPADSTLSRTP